MTLYYTKGVIDYKSEYRIRHRIRRNQAIDFITLKLKSETVKPAPKQVSRFPVLFSTLPLFTINKIICFLLYLRNRVIQTLFSFLICGSNRSRSKAM